MNRLKYRYNKYLLYNKLKYNKTIVAQMYRQELFLVSGQDLRNGCQVNNVNISFL